MMESKEQMNEMLQQEPTPAEKDRKRMDGLLSPSKENQTKDICTEVKADGGVLTLDFLEELAERKK